MCWKKRQPTSSTFTKFDYVALGHLWHGLLHAGYKINVLPAFPDHDGFSLLELRILRFNCRLCLSRH